MTENLTSSQHAALRYLAGEAGRFPKAQTLHALERKGLIERHPETLRWVLSRQGWIYTTGSYPINEETS